MYELVLNLTNVLLVLGVFIFFTILGYIKPFFKPMTSFFNMVIGFIVLTSEWNFIIGLALMVVGLFQMFEE